MRLRLVALLASLLLTGCLMPTKGTPVWVDQSTGSYWSGRGLLLEVSEDRQRCRIAARDPALIVRERWVACTGVHTRRDW